MRERMTKVADIGWNIFESAAVLLVGKNSRIYMAAEAYRHAQDEGLRGVPAHIRFTGSVLAKLGDRRIVDAMNHGLEMNASTRGGIV